MEIRRHPIAYASGLMVVAIGAAIVAASGPLAAWLATIAVDPGIDVAPDAVRSAIEGMPGVVRVVCMGIGAVVALVGVVRIVRLAAIGITATDTGLMVRTGIIMRRVDLLEWFRVRDLAIIRPIWMAPFRAGHIIIWSGDATTPVLMLPGVAQADVALLEIRDAVMLSRGVAGMVNIV